MSLAQASASLPLLLSEVSGPETYIIKKFFYRILRRIGSLQVFRNKQQLFFVKVSVGLYDIGSTLETPFINTKQTSPTVTCFFGKAYVIQLPPTLKTAMY